VLDATPALHAALVAYRRAGAVADGTGSRYRCGHRSNSCVKLKSPAARRFGMGSERVGVSFQDARRDDRQELRARKASLPFRHA
jgi:hypothetical protein